MDDYLSARNITVVNKILARGLQDKELELQMINLLSKRSDAVKSYFCSHSKLAGFNKILASLQRGDNDVDIMQVIQGGESKNKTNKTKNRKEWDKLTADEKYARVMYLEDQLTKVK